jgi:hypothetical protein
MTPVPLPRTVVMPLAGPAVLVVALGDDPIDIARGLSGALAVDDGRECTRNPG